MPRAHKAGETQAAAAASAAALLQTQSRCCCAATTCCIARTFVAVHASARYNRDGAVVVAACSAGGATVLTHGAAE